METFIAILMGLCFLAVFAFLIIGLINPYLVLKWVKVPTRLKVFGWWFLFTICASIIFPIILSLSETESDKMKAIEKNIKNKDYSYAISKLQKISEESEFKGKADSLLIITTKLHKEQQDSIKRAELIVTEKANKEHLESKKQELISQINKELASIKKGVDFSSNNNSVEALQMNLVIFSSWASLIDDALASDDTELNTLGSNLKMQVEKVQIVQFPLLRKEYVNIVAKAMWVNDIEVSGSGSSTIYINFTGGLFAANKNKQDFQEQVHSVLNQFRFKQSMYRWYKGQNEYTYYTIFQGNDKDLVRF
jgi:hypothetical protein